MEAWLRETVGAWMKDRPTGLFDLDNHTVSRPPGQAVIKK
jgi:hypothetical protein